MTLKERRKRAYLHYVAATRKHGLTMDIDGGFGCDVCGKNAEMRPTNTCKIFNTWRRNVHNHSNGPQLCSDCARSLGLLW